MNPTTPFVCPVCQLPLELFGRSYVCANAHSYDIAKEGYVNLVLANQKRSANPGDSEAMITSRQRFLNAGYYNELARTLVNVVESSGAAPGRLLDMGCGEGYYLQALHNQLVAPVRPQLMGLDVAKPAVRLAAKRDITASWAVASAYDMPVADHSVATALSVFSPISPSETQRVLAPGGRLIMVGPGPDHLRGLVREIYDTAVPHQGNFQTIGAGSGLTLVQSLQVNSSITVLNDHLLDLLRMTPYYWHTNPAQQANLTALESLKTDVQFDIRVYSVA